jgi:hypothetical protein
METPQQKQLRVDLEHRLVKDLEAMRDTLTHLSLALHDLKFEVEIAQCPAIPQPVSDCIARSQAREH